jgi:hypothetical protein
VVVLAFVVLANVVPHLNGILHHGVPKGVGQAVEGYYSDVSARDVSGAASLVCPTARPTWLAGQQLAASDSKRSIVAHSITSTSSDGHDSYTVRVAVTIGVGGTGPTSATVKVLKQGSDYFLCGGTSP